MKISIITVCYNSSSTIEETFKSVEQQTYHDIEYIVIDGGSTDGTVDLIKKNQHIIDKWVSEPDKGLYDAMNKGIKMSTGEYVGIINADDIFFDVDVISKVADFFCKNHLDASIGNVVQYRDDGKIIRKYNSKKWLPSKLKIGFMPPHPSIFIRRAIYQKLGGYKLNFAIGADFELVTRYFLKNAISWKYFDISTHRMLIGGLSSSGLKSYNQVTKEIMKALDMNNVEYSSLIIRLRGVWKIFELIKK